MDLKKTLQLKLPTIYKVLQIIWRRIQPTVYHFLYLIKHDHNFADFIKNLSESQQRKLPDDLSLMINAYFKSSSHQKTSKYWNYLNIKNINQLISDGYDNFKQSVGRNYFLFTDVTRFSDLITHTKNYSLNIESSEIFKKHSSLDIQKSIQVNLITSLLANHYLNSNGGKITLEEPIIGNPPYIIIDGKRVTLDLMVSLNEYCLLKRFIDLESINSILEIGAGYGRTAYVILKHLPRARYLICDIPPALYLSKTYLEQCFPEKKSVFIPSDLGDEEIKQIIKQNDLIFFLPDLLDKIESVDLFLAIDCLHEMKKDVIDSYITTAERITDYFYFTVYRDARIYSDNIRLSSQYYLRGRTWNSLLQEDRLFPDKFFHGLYQVN